MGNPDSSSQKQVIEKKTLFRRPPGQGDMRSEVFKLLHSVNGSIDLDGLRSKIQAAPNQVFMILLDLYKENRVSKEVLELIIEECMNPSTIQNNRGRFFNFLEAYNSIEEIAQYIQKKISEI